MPKVATPKYQTIAADLRRAIAAGKVRSGECLPSQNELTARYGVATGTVRQALSQLSADGWVQPQKGRGVVVRTAAARHTPATTARETAVGFAIFGDYSEYEPESQVVLHGAMSVLQEAGYNILYRIFRPEEDLAAALPDYLASMARLIFMRDVTAEVVEMIRAAGVHAVFQDYRPPSDHDPRVSVVRCESEPSGHMAAQQLLMHGHRRLALFTAKPESNEHVRYSLAGMRRACREYECGEPSLWCATDRRLEHDAARQLAADKGITGVVVLDDMAACRLIRSLTDLGVNIPADKSVVSIGGLSRDHLSEPMLCRVNRHYHRIGAEAARLALQAGRQVVHSYLNVTFEAGRTLAKADDS